MQRKIISILSVIGLVIFIAVLFPQVQEIIVRFIEQKMQRKLGFHTIWAALLFSIAMGGICLILFINYCIHTASGRKLVSITREEIKDCLVTIDFHSLLKPVLWMFLVYSLGILTIIRANYLYEDDIWRAVGGERGWYSWSRYVAEILSILVHTSLRMTDISPLPQLLAALILSVSSVLLVYILCDKKITTVSLLASIPLGLSPYFLECLSYKFDAPYMALSVLASIVPFLFLTRKKAFVFCSVVSLLILYMTYQAASGIYLMITVVLCFNYWNSKQKTNREIFLFLGRAALSFCMAMVIFKLFLMRPFNAFYVSNTTLPLSQIFSGTFDNLLNYISTINSDMSFIWKICIVIVVIFFIFRSVHISSQKKPISLIVSFFIICLSFILSYGIYYVLKQPLFEPRALFGFGAWLAILCVYVASNYKKTAIIAVLALNWCFFVFAFSYGNALADQKRYVDFRATILLNDLSTLYPDKDENEMTVQLKNKMGFTPSVRSIAKHNPLIYRLLKEKEHFINIYILEHFNYAPSIMSLGSGTPDIDYSTIDLPIVMKSYYHTIKSDGKRVLVELHEGVKMK